MTELRIFALSISYLLSELFTNTFMTPHQPSPRAHSLWEGLAHDVITWWTCVAHGAESGSMLLLHSCISETLRARWQTRTWSIKASLSRFCPWIWLSTGPIHHPPTEVNPDVTAPPPESSERTRSFHKPEEHNQREEEEEVRKLNAVLYKFLFQHCTISTYLFLSFSVYSHAKFAERDWKRSVLLRELYPPLLQCSSC